MTMNIADVFKLRVPDKYGNWGLELRQPLRTTDAKFYTRGAMGTGRARDAILSPPTQAELAENAKRVATMSGLDLGRVWAGDLTEKLDLIKDRKQLGDTLSALVTTLADYGSERGRGKGAELDDLNTLKVEGGDEDPTLEGKGKPHPDDPGTARTGDAMRKWRDEDAKRNREVQKTNRAFWDKKPAA
jgi:hypothetical protein